MPRKTNQPEKTPPPVGQVRRKPPRSTSSKVGVHSTEPSAEVVKPSALPEKSIGMPDTPQASLRNVWSWAAIGYAGLSLVFLAVAIVLLVYFHQESASAGDFLSGQVYYVILVVLGLSGAIAVFGAMRSVAIWRGRAFGGMLEASGPIVGAAAVVIGGLMASNIGGNFSVTVELRSPHGTSPPIREGTVRLALDDDPREVSLGPNGDARISGIAARFSGRSVNLWVDAPGFQSVVQDVTLRPNARVSVPMTLGFPFEVVVRTHLLGDSLAILNGCDVSIDLGEYGHSMLMGKTDDKGEVKFSAISAQLRNRPALVKAACPAHKMVYPGKEYPLTSDRALLIPMQRPSSFTVAVRPHTPKGCLTPIHNAKVTFNLDGLRSAIVDSNGTARFPEIPGDHYNRQIPVRIDAAGFQLHDNAIITLAPDAQNCLPLRPASGKLDPDNGDVRPPADASILPQPYIMPPDPQPEENSSENDLCKPGTIKVVAPNDGEVWNCGEPPKNASKSNGIWKWFRQHDGQRIVCSCQAR